MATRGAIVKKVKGKVIFTSKLAGIAGPGELPSKPVFKKLQPQKKTRGGEPINNQHQQKQNQQPKQAAAGGAEAKDPNEPPEKRRRLEGGNAKIGGQKQGKAAPQPKSAATPTAIAQKQPMIKASTPKAKPAPEAPAATTKPAPETPAPKAKPVPEASAATPSAPPKPSPAAKAKPAPETPTTKTKQLPSAATPPVQPKPSPAAKAKPVPEAPAATPSVLPKPSTKPKPAAKSAAQQQKTAQSQSSSAGASVAARPASAASSFPAHLLKPYSFCVAAGTYDSQVFGWTWTGRGLIRRFAVSDHTRCVTAVAAAARLLVSASQDETAHVYNARKFVDVGSIHDATSSINTLDFSGSSTLVAGCADGSIATYNARNFVRKAKLPGHYAAVLSVSVHPTQSLLLSAGADHRVNLIDMATGRTRKHVKYDKRDSCHICTWTPGGQRVVVAKQRSLHVFTAAEFAQLPKSAREDGTDAKVAVQDQAAAGDEGAPAEGADNQAVQPYGVNIHIGDQIQSLCSVDDRFALVGTSTHALLLVDLEKNLVVDKQVEHEGRVRGVAVLRPKEDEEEGNGKDKAAAAAEQQRRPSSDHIAFSVCTTGRVCMWRVVVPTPEHDAEPRLSAVTRTEIGKDVRFTCVTVFQTPSYAHTKVGARPAAPKRAAPQAAAARGAAEAEGGESEQPVPKKRRVTFQEGV